MRLLFVDFTAGIVQKTLTLIQCTSSFANRTYTSLCEYVILHMFLGTSAGDETVRPFAD